MSKNAETVQVPLQWVIITLRRDGEWRPVIGTLSGSKRVALRRYGAHGYAEKQVKAGMAKAVQCRLWIVGCQNKLVDGHLTILRNL
jgi:hypothetical protein